MRRAARVDGPHAAIVKALRKLHAFVVDLSRVGEGCPDLLVGWKGTWVLYEVKDGRKPPSAQALTPPQLIFHASAQDMRLPCYVVRDVKEALDMLPGGRLPPAAVRP